MTAALYPTTIYPLIGYSIEHIFYTQTTPMKSGVDVAEKLFDRARYRINLSYKLKPSDAVTLLQFHEARYGAYEAFDFYDFHKRTWSNVYVGIGTSSTATFDLPTRTLYSYPSIYVDGVAVGASNFSISDNAGTNGRDTITFDAGHEPDAGKVITCDFTGTRVFSCRFENDILRYTTLGMHESWPSGATTEWVEFNTSLITQLP